MSTPDTSSSSSPTTTDIVNNIPTDDVIIDENSIAGYIPEPPTVVFEDNIILNALGEPTLQSLGLAGWGPTGLVQMVLEFIHVNLGFSWIGSIVLFTVVLRCCLFYFTIKAQRNGANMRKISPRMNELKEKHDLAKKAGNSIETQRALHEYINFVKSNTQVKMMFLPLIQFPFVISTFLGINRMCKLPVESLTTSGMLWFPDLTLMDPYWLMPLFATGSIVAIITRGIDTGITNVSPTMKMVAYGFTIPGLLIFGLNVPAGTMVYICTTNFISLLVAYILSFNRAKAFFRIPIPTDAEIKLIKESSAKAPSLFSKFQSKREENKKIKIYQAKEKEYNEAGKQLPVRTYKRNPKLNDPPK